MRPSATSRVFSRQEKVKESSGGAKENVRAGAGVRPDHIGSGAMEACDITTFGVGA